MAISEVTVTILQNEHNKATPFAFTARLEPLYSTCSTLSMKAIKP
jgi:hypothetical protein